MIYQRRDRESFINLSILYLKYRNSYNFGLQPYKFWKNMIKYITGVNHPRQLRSLFSSLIIRNYIQVKKNKKNSMKYLFNPNKLDMSLHNKVEKTVDFSSYLGDKKFEELFSINY